MIITPDAPYNAQSIWRALPVNAEITDQAIPDTGYWPVIAADAFGVSVHVTRPTDMPMRVHGRPPDQDWGGQGIVAIDVGDEPIGSIRLARWPADVRVPEGTDGHVIIIDAPTARVHDFWRLRQVDGRWEASQYAWSSLTGTGWPTPERYQIGSRSSGVPTLGGLMRTHEVADDRPTFGHVLAMALPETSLASCVWPATRDDQPDIPYSGSIGMGSLVMLSPGFDVNQLRDPLMRKIARTLMRYGARVVDRVHRSRFALFAEVGSGAGRLDQGQDDLKLIGDALRVARAPRYLTPDGKWLQFDRAPNLLSMRGGATGWQDEQYRPVPDLYDTYSGMLQMSVAKAGRTYRNWATYYSTRQTRWSPWVPGQRYRLTVQASGGAMGWLQFERSSVGLGPPNLVDMPPLGDGQSCVFVLPRRLREPIEVVQAGARGPSSLRMTLTQVSAGTPITAASWHDDGAVAGIPRA